MNFITANMEQLFQDQAKLFRDTTYSNITFHFNNGIEINCHVALLVHLEFHLMILMEIKLNRYVFFSVCKCSKLYCVFFCLNYKNRGETKPTEKVYEELKEIGEMKEWMKWAIGCGGFVFLWICISCAICCTAKYRNGKKVNTTCKIAKDTITFKEKYAFHPN